MLDGEPPDRQQDTVIVNTILNGSSLAYATTKTSASGVFSCGNPSQRLQQRCLLCLHASRPT
jgi:hypothetical protein